MPDLDREAGTAGSGTLAGMRIVVTGAAQGIGASTLRAYVAAGADVAALDVNAGDGAASAAAADAAGPGTAWFLRCDVGSPSSIHNRADHRRQRRDGNGALTPAVMTSPLQGIHDYCYTLI